MDNLSLGYGLAFRSRDGKIDGEYLLLDYSSYEARTKTKTECRKFTSACESRGAGVIIFEGFPDRNSALACVKYMRNVSWNADGRTCLDIEN